MTYPQGHPKPTGIIADESTCHGKHFSETYCVMKVMVNLFQSCHYFECLGYVSHSQDTFETKTNGTLFIISRDRQARRSL